MVHFNARLEAGAVLGKIGRIKARVENPLGEGRGELIAELVIRKGGVGSVRDQFEKEAAGDGSKDWDRSQPFGNWEGGNTALQRSGRYRDAWLDDGPGAITLIQGNRLEVGVDRTLFPQVRVFQRDHPTTIFANDANRTEPKPRKTKLKKGEEPSRGQLKMRMFLGMEYGVWLTEEKLLIRGIEVDARPVRAGAELRASYKRALAALLVGKEIEA